MRSVNWITAAPQLKTLIQRQRVQSDGPKQRAGDQSFARDEIGKPTTKRSKRLQEQAVTKVNWVILNGKQLFMESACVVAHTIGSVSLAVCMT